MDFREMAEKIFKKAGESHYSNTNLCEHCIDVIAGELRAAYSQGVRDCMKISDGEAPDYPADLISGCKYHVTEKMLALIDDDIANALKPPSEK